MELSSIDKISLSSCGYYRDKRSDSRRRFISVVFRESVRKNARDCFEKKGFAENRHFQGTANFGHLEAIKCHFEARNGKFGQILSRIQSYFIFCPLHLAVKGPCRKSSLSRNSKFRVLRGN